MSRKRKTYKYIVELSEEMWPRYIADIMSMGSLAYRLLSVTDQQRDDHWYGQNGRTQSATYQVSHDECEPMTHAAMLAHYQALFNDATGEVEKDAYYFITALLRCSWVPGNMGMLHSYVKEFIRHLDTFVAHCEHNGKFAKDDQEVK